MTRAALAKQAEEQAERQRSLQERQKTGQRQRLAAAAAKQAAKEQKAEALVSYCAISRDVVVVVVRGGGSRCINVESSSTRWRRVLTLDFLLVSIFQMLLGSKYS